MTDFTQANTVLQMCRLLQKSHKLKNDGNPFDPRWWINIFWSQTIGYCKKKCLLYKPSFLTNCLVQVYEFMFDADVSTLWSDGPLCFHELQNVHASCFTMYWYLRPRWTQENLFLWRIQPAGGLLKGLVNTAFLYISTSLHFRFPYALISGHCQQEQCQ